MTDNEYEAVGYLHDARICLHSAQSCLSSAGTQRVLLKIAQKYIEKTLSSKRFFVSVSTDEAWIGSNGMYVDYGTFAYDVAGGERLSHFIWPLPSGFEDFLVALVDIVEALPATMGKER